MNVIYCSIEAALSVFSQMRPPGIYKQEYLNELFSRYGDRDDTPAAPSLPDWCLGRCLPSCHLVCAIYYIQRIYVSMKLFRDASDV